MESMGETFKRLLAKNDPLLSKQAVQAYITLESTKHPQVVYPADIRSVCVSLLHGEYQAGDESIDAIFRRLEARNQPHASPLHESVLAWNQTQLARMRLHFDGLVANHMYGRVSVVRHLYGARQVLGLSGAAPFESELTAIEDRLRDAVSSPAGVGDMVAWQARQAERVEKLAACELIRAERSVRIDEIGLDNAESFLQRHQPTVQPPEALVARYQSRFILAMETTHGTVCRSKNARYLTRYASAVPYSYL